MKLSNYILIIFQFFLASICIAEELIITPDLQLKYADNLFEKGEYYRAISEYERFLFFFPNNSKYQLAQFQIGMSYFHGKRYNKAIQCFEKLTDSDEFTSDTEKAHFMAAACYENEREWLRAIDILDDLIRKTDDNAIKDKAYFTIACLYIQTDNSEKASQIFQKINNKNKYKTQNLIMALKGKAPWKTKKPRLAGLLAIIPGAGHLYCGRYRDALLAFIVNGGLIYAAYESFEDDNNGLGGIISFFGSGFYGGNIYSAISSAHKYNKRQRINYLQNLKRGLEF